MATTAKPKTNGSTRKPTASRSAKTSNGRTPRASDGRFKGNSAIPGWAATVASVVGVGVAIGAGLFATRRQWMPQAERWGDQIATRFRHEEDENEFYGDSIADRDDEENWDDTEKVSRAAYPDRDIYPGAQAVS